jgi:hypothetical protein
MQLRAGIAVRRNKSYTYFSATGRSSITNVKTAISLPKLLFERSECVAEEMKITPSHLMALALEEFINRRHN